jgi:hypothetical protein
MRINIKTIPHCKQRYEACGDYWIDKNGAIQIRISECNDTAEWLVALHELTEIFLCIQKNVPFESIDKFDIKFEKNRDADSTEEPGDATDAPYRDQHCLATAVERMICGYLGISWKLYENSLNELEYRKPEHKKPFRFPIPKVD